jgi:hypothetical protein
MPFEAGPAFGSGITVTDPSIHRQLMTA